MPILLLFCCLWSTSLFAQEAEAYPLKDQLHRLVANNPVFQQGYSGFCLYDPETENYIYDFRGDQRFTPASNVKLLTYYLTTQLLSRRVPALWYENYGSRLELWGTGFPSWEYLGIEQESNSPTPPPWWHDMQPNLRFVTDNTDWACRADNPVTDWLRQQQQAVVLHLEEEMPARYGAGWSYDDWNDGYVYERSSLPLFANRLTVSVDSSGELQVEPACLTDRVVLANRPDGPRLLRRETENIFSLDTSRQLPPDYERSIALRITPELIEELLAEQIDQSVRIGDRPLPVGRPGLNLLRFPLPDTLFQVMLQQSDNYLAEQFLLLAAASRYGRPAVREILSYARDTLLEDLSEPAIQWVDGSGLSRYNQISPRQLVRVLDLTRRAVGWERLLRLLPANGESGTLERRFVNDRAPYIWAKTGSLRNVMALSGVLQTRSGKYLLFSFLHNHTQEGSTTYYREMEKVFELLYQTY